MRAKPTRDRPAAGDVVAGTIRLPHEPERLAFSRDGALLVSNGEMLETHVVEAASGAALAGERMKDGMAAVADFGRQLLAALQAGAKESDLLGGEDIMHREFGGPRLTAAGQAYAKSLDGPTGIEPFDQAAGLTRKPKAVGRRLSPDGSQFLAVDHESLAITLIDARAHKVLARVAEKAAEQLPPREFAAGGGAVAVTTAGRVVGVYDPKTGKRRAAFAGHLHDVRAVALSADAALAASADASGAVAVWSAADGKVLGWAGTFKTDALALAFAAHGGRPLLAVADGPAVRLLDAATARPVAAVAATALGGRRCTAVAATPDGATLAVGVGRTAALCDVAAIVRGGVALPKDDVGPIPAPTAEAQDAARRAESVKFRAPLDAKRDAIEADVRQIFDRLPPGTARVHFEADLGPWDPKTVGVYWAAQDKRGRTLVAFKLESTPAPIGAVVKARARSKTEAFDDLVAAERAGVAGFFADVWQAAKAAAKRPKLRGIYTQTPMGKGITDLDTGELLDYATHRYPKR